jgi:hypothetical protein
LQTLLKRPGSGAKVEWSYDPIKREGKCEHFSWGYSIHSFIESRECFVRLNICNQSKWSRICREPKVVQVRWISQFYCPPMKHSGRALASSYQGQGFKSRCRCWILERKCWITTLNKLGRFVKLQKVSLFLFVYCIFPCISFELITRLIVPSFVHCFS